MSMNDTFVLQQNDQSNLIDIYTEFFMGTAGEGIMQGVNVGTAFLNAQKKYWAYSKSRSEKAASFSDYDKLTILENMLYGVPIYKPNMQDPSIIKNYSFEYTNVYCIGEV